MSIPMSESAYAEMAAAALTPEKRFMAAAHAGRNIFLTGAAGTGKSTNLRSFLHENASSSVGGELRLDSTHRSISVTAPTGVAALNVGGTTINRYAGMLIGPEDNETNEDCAQRLFRSPYPSLAAGRKRVENCECLVIDEISMMAGRQFDFLDFWFRKIRKIDEPFGGCQIIVIGDFLQLPPVRKGNDPYDWAFNTDAWKNARFLNLKLDKIYRQDEPEFIQALMDLRIGKVWGKSATLFQSRVVQFPDGNLTRIFTHNSMVDKWNHYKLDCIDGPEAQYVAETSGPDQQVKFLVNNLVTPSDLRLKPTALVMMTVNDPKEQFVNGSIGVVKECRSDRVIVQLKNGNEVAVERRTWSNNTKNGDENETAKFVQFPLRLAYAMTIHKSQGISLDGAYIDIRAAREPGQAYTAVSRVRTVRGLHFKEWFKGIFCSQEAINFYDEL